MKYNFVTIILFVYLVGTASLAAYSNTIGDTIEKSTAFLSSVVGFLVVSVVLCKLLNQEIFSKRNRLLLAWALLALTVVEYLYPVIEYWDQNAGSSYYTLFVVELGINLLIARILSK